MSDRPKHTAREFARWFFSAYDTRCDNRADAVDLLARIVEERDRYVDAARTEAAALRAALERAADALSATADFVRSHGLGYHGTAIAIDRDADEARNAALEYISRLTAPPDGGAGT